MYYNNNNNIQAPTPVNQLPLPASVREHLEHVQHLERNKNITAFPTTTQAIPPPQPYQPPYQPPPPYTNYTGHGGVMGSGRGIVVPTVTATSLLRPTLDGIIHRDKLVERFRDKVTPEIRAVKYILEQIQKRINEKLNETNQYAPSCVHDINLGNSTYTLLEGPHDVVVVIPVNCPAFSGNVSFTGVLSALHNMENIYKQMTPSGMFSSSQSNNNSNGGLGHFGTGTVSIMERAILRNLGHSNQPLNTKIVRKYVDDFLRYMKYQVSSMCGINFVFKVSWSDTPMVPLPVEPMRMLDSASFANNVRRRPSAPVPQTINQQQQQQRQVIYMGNQNGNGKTMKYGHNRDHSAFENDHYSRYSFS